MSQEIELQKAIEVIHAGNRKKALPILIAFVKQHPRHEKAWLYLSSIVDGTDKQLKCLEQVLKINPTNEIAQQRISKLQQMKGTRVHENKTKRNDISRSRMSASKTPSSEELNLSPIKKISPKRKSVYSTTTGQSGNTKKSGHETSKINQVNAQPTTKKCPYCAETIKAKAIICRFCGKDLTDDQARKVSDNISVQIIDEFVAQRAEKGWQVLSRTNNSVHMRRPKQWSKTLLVLGFLGLLLFGTGIIFLLLAVIDYILFQKEKTIHVTADQIHKGDIPRDPQAFKIGLALAFIFACMLGVIALRVSDAPSNTPISIDTSTPEPTPSPTRKIQRYRHFGDRGNIVRHLEYDLGITDWRHITNNNNLDTIFGVSDDEMVVIELRNDPVTMAEIGVAKEIEPKFATKAILAFLSELGLSDQAQLWIAENVGLPVRISRDIGYATLIVNPDTKLNKLLIRVEINDK